MTGVSSLVFFTPAAAGLAAVLQAVGVRLEPEVHDDGVEHWAGELGEVHVAVYLASEEGTAPGRRAPGSIFPGFWVDDLDATLAAVRAAGGTIAEGHEEMPWGCRFVVAAPGGYAIEVNQAGHCRDAPVP